jgi:hypothetical protein
MRITTKAFEAAHPDESGDPHLDKVLSNAMEQPKSEAPNLDKAIAASAEPAEGTPVDFSPQWEFTKEQRDAVLRQSWGEFRFPEYMADVNDQANFVLLFDKFIQSREDGRFLGELFQKMGNHPTGVRLYHHLIQLAKRGDYENSTGRLLAA